MKNSKKERFSISIPNPCHENWNEMKAEEQGRFCLKCAKTVVDFTQKSKEQIISYFEELSGKVCGRFLNEQLTAEPIKLKVNQHKMRIFTCALYLVFGSFLFSCTSKKVSKKDQEIKVTTGVVLPSTAGEVDANESENKYNRSIENMINEIGAANEQSMREEKSADGIYTMELPAAPFLEEEVVFEEIKPTSVKESPIPDTNSQDSDQIIGVYRLSN